MAVSSRNSWGVQTAFNPVTQNIAGVISVLPNVGVALQVVAGGSGISLVNLAYRVDLAPDVAVGTVTAPSRWRLCVMAGQLPQDISLFQKQAFASGSHPEIPSNTSQGVPIPLLIDEWLDFTAGDPGLNQRAVIAFSGGGPSVAGGETMTILLTPIIDATISQALPGVANAMMYLEAYGAAPSAGAFGGGSNGADGTKSLPRFAVHMGGG